MVDDSVPGGVAAHGPGMAAWAAHSSCGRFRGTDPAATGMGRRALSQALGHPDTTAGIPAARWNRSLVFTGLATDPVFAGELTARVTGWGGLPRPESVTSVDCRGEVNLTREALAAAVERAFTGEATLLRRLTFQDDGAGSPLAVVARNAEGAAKVLLGGIKDYERVRSRIEDSQLLTGFLAVAESVLALAGAPWLPAGLAVAHTGFLVVPRNAFLQPGVEVENLRDHLVEVAAAASARAAAAESRAESGETSLATYVSHLDAAYNPGTCPSCALFTYCRNDIRTAADEGNVAAALSEIGIPPTQRPLLAPLITNVTSDESVSGAPVAAARLVRATVTGRAVPTGSLRTDPVGRPGSIDLVLAKSDAAALGCHGVSLRVHDKGGPGAWRTLVFSDPQAAGTRYAVMEALGEAVTHAMEITGSNPESGAIHLVVPDTATADLLAGIADLLAGVELSRLRWARDAEMGRPLLTWDGDPATQPDPLMGPARTAVSFLLEHDRARMFTLRTPVVVLTDVLNRLWTPGGAQRLASRLDYVTGWLTSESPVQHREVEEQIEASPHTPGARLANSTSDTLTQAQNAHDAPGEYTRLVTDELAYKATAVEDANAAIRTLQHSRVSPVVQALESGAQEVWRRRLALQASDLVRFGRTYPSWRNTLVVAIDTDNACRTQLSALCEPLTARSMAEDQGNRTLTTATVTDTSPLTVQVMSRQFTAGTTAILLTLNDRPWVESDAAAVEVKKTTIQFHGFPRGPLMIRDAAGEKQSQARDAASEYTWNVKDPPHLEVGDRLVLASDDFVKTAARWFNVARPSYDTTTAPKPDCRPGSYEEAPEEHAWCCKPHALIEAEFSDLIAARREERVMNPHAWPPVRDADGFDITPLGRPTAGDVSLPTVPVPAEATTDEF